MRSSEFIAEQQTVQPKTPAQQRLETLRQQIKMTQAQVKRERAQKSVRKAQQQMSDALKIS
jgi:uncharacterized protein YlxW (UPF0749 family)